MGKPIVLALSKGRVFTEALPFLEKAGIRPENFSSASRRLMLDTNVADLKLLLVRATDVPVYVRYGAADMGFIGSDVLLESGMDDLYRVLDLQIARCRLMVAVADPERYEHAVQVDRRIRVATKYVAAAKSYFAKIGVHVDLIKLYGSVELAPLTGLSDAIVDLVSTGSTLRENGLVSMDLICNVSTQVVVNQASLTLRPAMIKSLVSSFNAKIKGSKDGK